MEEVINIKYWKGVIPSPISIILSDQNNLDFIQKVHKIFKPFRPKGIIRTPSPGIQEHITKLISEDDVIYIEPALVAEFLGNKQWEELTVADGAFLLNNGPWLNDKEWLGTLPYVIEFLLRANDLSGLPVSPFIFYLTEVDTQRFEGTPLPLEIKVTICDFVGRFKHKRMSELAKYPEERVYKYDLVTEIEDLVEAEKIWVNYSAS